MAFVQVEVAGSFNGWTREALHWNGTRHEKTLTIERNETYQYKYIINDQWVCNADEPTTWDGAGNQNNMLEC